MRRSNDRLMEIVGAALGEVPVASLGLLTKSEAAKLAQLQRLASVLAQPHYAAPASLVRSAKEIFESPASDTARVTSTSLRTATAARGAAEVLHAAFVSHSGDVRVMYVRESDGWRVVGQAPGPGWRAITDEDVVDCDDMGRFETVVHQDLLPEVLLVAEGRRVVVPAPQTEP